MIKTYCDICGAEAKIEKQRITTEYDEHDESAWKNTEMDVCEMCRINLRNLYRKVENEFVKRKGYFNPKFD